MYKAVINDNYLCHFNKNHSPKNGQFTSGDGDGDGIANDHANQKEKKKKGLSRKAKVGLAIAGGVVGTAAMVAGAIGLGKEFSNANMGKKLGDATIKGMQSKGNSFTINKSNVPLLEATTKTSRDNKEFKNLSKSLNDSYKDYKKSVQISRYMNIKYNKFGMGENKYKHLSKDLNAAYSEYRRSVDKFRKKG